MTQGIINTNLEYGNDLVQWVAIGGACELCMPLNGKVYSISGKNADFPMLNDPPPLHPNCRCVLAPITEEGMAYKGNYGELSRLSKG
jgi:hypothetical protein